MLIGACGGPERVVAAAKSGFDYLEARFYDLYKLSDKEYFEFNELLIKNSLPCKAANCFIGGGLRITGNDVDYKLLEDFMKTAYKRAAEMGIEVVVLGSSGARNVDGNTSYQRAVEQICTFVKTLAAPMAADYNIDFVFEPLCKRESNIINTIKEGAMLAAAINLSNVGTLADLYHMHVENDTYDDIRELKGILRHAHISNPVPADPRFKRVYMKDENEYDYRGFFDALKYAGCERVSIEADTVDFENDAPDAARIMSLYK